MTTPDPATGIAGLWVEFDANPDWLHGLSKTITGADLEYLKQPASDQPYLALTSERLELRWPDSGMHPLYIDFNDPAVHSRIRSGRRDPLARALGIHKRHHQSVFDATCGLGRDSALLLGLGCHLKACERSPVLALLLQDGVRRARNVPPTCDWFENWQGLWQEDAVALMTKDEWPRCNAIYLDPMFRAPRRRALPGRDMQYLQTVVGPDQDIHELLTTARQAEADRVVLKRHPRQPQIIEPNYSVKTRQVCFDVYLTGVKP